jgi:plastocyanin
VRKLLVLVAIVSIVAGVGAAVAFARTKSVGMGDNYFLSGSVTIKKGSSVHWHWSNTQNLHNVSSTKGVRFRSRTGRSGSFTYTFNKRGTFTIICTRHSAVMRMKVKVL